MIGFFKEFPSEIVSGWGSGTGMAGVFGSGLLIFLRTMNVSLTIVIKFIL